MVYEIGSRVTVKSWDELPPDVTRAVSEDDPRLIAKGKAKLCGRSGVVVERYKSEAYDCTCYRIRFDGCKYASRAVFCGDLLRPEEAFDWNAHEYTIRIERDGKRVRVSLVDISDGKSDVLNTATAQVRGDDFTDFMQAVSFGVRCMFVGVSR